MQQCSVDPKKLNVHLHHQIECDLLLSIPTYTAHLHLILTASVSSLLSKQDPYAVYPTVQRIHILLHTITQQYIILFMWILGHIDLQYSQEFLNSVFLMSCKPNEAYTLSGPTQTRSSELGKQIYILFWFPLKSPTTLSHSLPTWNIATAPQFQQLLSASKV